MIFSALARKSSSAKVRICLRLTAGWRSKGKVSSDQRSGRLARRMAAYRWRFALAGAIELPPVRRRARPATGTPPYAAPTSPNYLAGAFQRQQQTATDHIAERAVGLLPIPGLAQFPRQSPTAGFRIRGDQLSDRFDVREVEDPSAIFPLAGHLDSCSLPEM